MATTLSATITAPLTEHTPAPDPLVRALLATTLSASSSAPPEWYIPPPDPLTATVLLHTAQFEITALQSGKYSPAPFIPLTRPLTKLIPPNRSVPLFMATSTRSLAPASTTVVSRLVPRRVRFGQATVRGNTSAVASAL